MEELWPTALPVKCQTELQGPLFLLDLSGLKRLRMILAKEERRTKYKIIGIVRNVPTRNG